MNHSPPPQQRARTRSGPACRQDWRRRRWVVGIITAALVFALPLRNVMTADADSTPATATASGSDGAFDCPGLFLQDGRALPSPFGADFRGDLLPVPLGEIDRLEIVVTRGVWQWEGRPVGCVINLVSRRAVETLEFSRNGEGRWPLP